MKRTDTVVIGAGQAGLALSYELTRRGVDHVVVDRGRVGERWRSERPADLRLLTPNWMSRLPGWGYRGPDPDGFMTAVELVASLDAWAASFAAPLEPGTTVHAVVPATGGFEVRTDRGTWRASQVVVATGHAQVPAVPAAARHVPAHVAQVVPTRYRGEAELPAGAVLVVGASATGLQLAEDLAARGRRTILAVGAHTRLPRRYRGMDILWWLDRMGVFDVRADQVADLERARRQPSWQLVGRPGGGDLDLVTARRAGVELVGRLVGVHGGVARFADDLPATTRAADRALERLLGRVDAHIAASGLEAEVLEAERPRPVCAEPARQELDLRAEGVGAVIWATGYRRRYPWLGVPVLDARGEVRQHLGVTPWPGLYTVGLRFQTTRSSSFIDGARHDAAVVADHIAAALGGPRPCALPEGAGR